jgi:hypothetical protein
MAINWSYLGFDKAEDSIAFLEICDLIYKVNTGHRDVFGKLWTCVEEESQLSLSEIVENAKLYSTLIKRDCREAYSRALECVPPEKFYEVDIEELVRMKEMIEENSTILS